VASAVEISLSGELLGGYRLESLLGVGAMGTVYLASHHRLGRKAAVKVLRQELAEDPKAASRFFREAKVANDVRHPNIVDIIDFVETEEPRRLAYVMEFVDGPTLAQLLKQRPLTINQALNAAEQLADALASVHRLEVIHRDLKPANILIVAPIDTDLSAHPSVKIVDFGICKIGGTHSDELETVPGIVMGTPAYMAPEQVAAKRPTAAADVYALGEIIYEMITGRRLFQGDQTDVLGQKLTKEPEIDLPGHVPAREDLIELISDCLRIDPGARPTAGAVKTRIASIRAAMSTLSAPLDRGLSTLADQTEPLRRTLPKPAAPARTPGALVRWATALFVVSLVLTLAVTIAVLSRPTRREVVVSAEAPVTRSVEPAPIAAPAPAVVEAPPPIASEPPKTKAKLAPRAPAAKDTKALKRKEMPQW
jgi:serine/threonine protein kinase